MSLKVLPLTLILILISSHSVFAQVPSAELSSVDESIKNQVLMQESMDERLKSVEQQQNLIKDVTSLISIIGWFSTVLLAVIGLLGGALLWVVLKARSEADETLKAIEESKRIADLELLKLQGMRKEEERNLKQLFADAQKRLAQNKERPSSVLDELQEQIIKANKAQEILKKEYLDYMNRYAIENNNLSRNFIAHMNSDDFKSRLAALERYLKDINKKKNE